MLDWDALLDTINVYNFSDRLLFVVGTVFFHVVIYWGFNLILHVFYYYNLFPQQRIQGGAMPSMQLIMACVQNRLLVHFIVQPVGLYLAYPLVEMCGVHLRGPLPSWQIFARDFAVSNVLNDFLFYWAHRTLHHKLLYKHFHKQHHMFNVSIGLASEYAHPVEDLFANLIPTLAGCFLMGSHAAVVWSWLTLRMLQTIDTHSGYSFQWSPFNLIHWYSGSRRHDFHHSHNQGCYGAGRLWDTLMGTDKEYLEYEEKLKKTN